MHYRNPVFSSPTTIDCEIEHPDYGWIPFTCDPADTGATFDTTALFEDMRPHAASYVPPPAPTPEEIAASHRAEAETARAAAYTAQADPIFFQYQRGEASEHDWLDKIAEIRARYPYPEA